MYVSLYVALATINAHLDVVVIIICARAFLLCHALLSYVQGPELEQCVAAIAAVAPSCRRGKLLRTCTPWPCVVMYTTCGHGVHHHTWHVSDA